MNPLERRAAIYTIAEMNGLLVDWESGEVREPVKKKE